MGVEFNREFTRGKHVSLYRKLLFYFPIFYSLAALTQRYFDPTYVNLIISLSISGAVFVVYWIVKYLDKIKHRCADLMTDIFVSSIIMILPFHVLFSSWYYSGQPGAIFYIINYFAIMIISSTVIYCNKFLSIYFIMNVILSFFVMDIIYPSLQHGLFAHLIFPVLTFCFAAVQYVSLRFFKLSLLNELFFEKEQLKQEREVQKQKGQFYLDISSTLDGMIVLDELDNVTLINEFLVDNEYARMQMLGKPYLNVFAELKMNPLDQMKIRFHINFCHTYLKTEEIVVKMNDKDYVVFVSPIIKENIVKGTVINIRPIGKMAVDKYQQITPKG